MKCPICGMVRNDQFLTCPRCGHNHTTEIQQIFCPDCGTPMPSQAKVCMMCGQPIDEPIRMRRMPRIPLPHWAWLPIPLPESVRVSAVLLIVLVVALLVILSQWTQPFASRAARPSAVAQLAPSTATGIATATPTETSTPTASATPTTTPTATATSTPVYHVVEAGENPGTIAVKYGLTIDQLMTANKIADPRTLREGQSLLIPPTAPPPGKNAPAEVQATATPLVYRVQAGDTLLSIAIWAGSTVDDIMKANSLKNASWLSVGQTLIIPVSAERQRQVTTPTPEVTEAVYIIQQGDSLLSIAQQFHAPLDAIMKANHIEDQELIRAGESLLVPLPAVPSPSPEPQSTSTPTPGPRYRAPTPLSPPNDQYFWNDTEPVLLNWMSVGILAADEWYVVQLKYTCGGQATVQYAWTRTSGWRVPAQICKVEAPTQQVFRWHVQIFNSQNVDIDPAGLKPASPPSAERTFYWH
jgi:LysM repeat protein